MKSADRKNEFVLKLALVLAGIASLTGCGGGSSSTKTGSGGGGGGTTPSAAKNVYVIQNSLEFPTTPGIILQFSATSSGSVQPESTIIPPAASDDLQGLATDAEGNVYVATRTQTAATTTLLEYAPGASGSATPIRSIPSNDTTRMWDPDGLAISSTGQIIVGEDNGGIATYSATANGSVAPEYYILGASQTGGGLSTINAAQSVAVGNGNLYVFNWNESGEVPIDIFPATATGNVAPIGYLGGSLTLLNVDSVGGIAVDSTGNVYVSSNTGSGGVIAVFAPTANGDVAPIRSIQGTATQLGTLGGIQVDAVGNIFVISTNAQGGNPTVLKFSATASGNVAPTLSFTSNAWTFPDDYFSLAVD